MMTRTPRTAVMKKVHWDFGAARKKYRDCDDDPFKFSAAMDVVSDLSEGIIESDGTETVFDEVCAFVIVCVCVFCDRVCALVSACVCTYMLVSLCSRNETKRSGVCLAAVS
jgi:hypothetical protein